MKRGAGKRLLAKRSSIFCSPFPLLIVSLLFILSGSSCDLIQFPFPFMLIQFSPFFPSSSLFFFGDVAVVVVATHIHVHTVHRCRHSKWDEGNVYIVFLFEFLWRPEQKQANDSVCVVQPARSPLHPRLIPSTLFPHGDEGSQ